MSLMIGAGIFCGHISAKPSAVSMGRKSTSSKGLLRVAWERKLLFERWITLWINQYPLNSAIGFPNILWIAIQPVDSAIHLLNNRGLAKISIPYLQFLLLSASLRPSLDFYVGALLSLFVAHDRCNITTVIFFSSCVQTEPNATSIPGTPPLRGHLPSRSRGYPLNKGSNEGNFLYKMTRAKSCCSIQDKNIDINKKKRQREKRLEVSRYFGPSNCLSSRPSSLNPPKKDGLSVRNIGKPQIAFLFAVLSLMSICSNAWIIESLSFLHVQCKLQVSYFSTYLGYPRLVI